MYLDILVPGVLLIYIHVRINNMNQQQILIDNACRIEVLAVYNQFTSQQRTELLKLLDDFKNTKPTKKIDKL